MSFVGPPFEWDVFVSYAHGKPPRGETKGKLAGWTKAFVAELEADLHYAIKGQAAEAVATQDPADRGGGSSTVEIWYDAHDVDGNAYLTDQLQAGLAKSALLLIIMTPDYLDSRWCGDERQWFEQELARRGQGVRNVFVVKAMPTDSGLWPGLLKDAKDATIPGYDFFPGDVPTARARPLGWPVPTDKSTSFHAALPDLSAPMAERLQELKQQGHQPGPTPGLAEPGHRFQPPIAANAGPVYLAPGSSYAKIRDEIRSRLVEAGVSVLPDQATTIAELTPEAFQVDLETSRVFAQVLGTSAHPSTPWGGCAVAGQHRRAVEANKPCLIHFKSALIEALDDDEDYHRFVESIREGAKGTPDELVQAVLEALADDQPRPKPSAYMHCPRGAAEAFVETRQTIEQALDCKVRPTKHQDANPKLGRILDDEDQRLEIYQRVDGVLFLNVDSAPDHWLRMKLEDLEDDRERLEPERTLRGLVLDRVGNARTVEAIYDGIDVISWPERPDPTPIIEWLRGIGA